MNKLLVIILNLCLSISLIAGNEGGNGGHNHELSWKLHSQQIEKALIHLKAVGEISGFFEEDLRHLNSFMLSSSKDYEYIEINRSEKIIRIPQVKFSKLNTNEQYCQTWSLLKREVKGFKEAKSLSCEYIQSISNFLFAGNWSVDIEAMIKICSENRIDTQSFTYVCSLNGKMKKLEAPNLLEASKKAAVLTHEENCQELNNNNFNISLRIYTSLNRVECFRE